jgi:hypothetical protein
MFPSSHSAPCPCFPVAVLFPDVEPAELEREAAHEASRSRRPGPWNAYLHRALPALERHVSGEMAQALLAAGTGAHASRLHAERMGRQAIAAGAMHRARFWSDVADEIRRSAAA